MEATMWQWMQPTPWAISLRVPVRPLNRSLVRGFFARPSDYAAKGGVQEAPLASLIAIGVTVTGCIILFFYPEPLVRLTEEILK